MERAHEVFALGQVDARFAAHAAVDLREQGGWNLHDAQTPKKHRRDEPREIAHDAAAQCQNHVGPVIAALSERA